MRLLYGVGRGEEQAHLPAPHISWPRGRPVPTCDPWIALAAMAVGTSRVRLGTSVTPLNRRRPWKVAREAVALDQLSNGRFILGVGSGDANEAGFSRVNEVRDAKERARILDEALDVILGLWSGEPYSYQGHYFQVHEMTFLPKPVQQPRIPILVGGGWPLKGPALRAARYDGCCLYKQHGLGDFNDWTPDEVRTLKAFMERHRSDQQREMPYEIKLGGRSRSERLGAGSRVDEVAGRSWSHLVGRVCACRRRGSDARKCAAGIIAD